MIIGHGPNGEKTIYKTYQDWRNAGGNPIREFEEDKTTLSDTYFEPRSPFLPTVLMGLITIGCVWGGCYGLQLLFGL